MAIYKTALLDSSQNTLYWGRSAKMIRPIVRQKMKGKFVLVWFRSGAKIYWNVSNTYFDYEICILKFSQMAEIGLIDY